MLQKAAHKNKNAKRREKRNDEIIKPCTKQGPDILGGTNGIESH